jgi:hypothetical protein
MISMARLTVDELWQIAMCVVSIRDKGIANSDSVKRLISVFNMGEKQRNYMLKVLYHVHHC